MTKLQFKSTRNEYTLDADSGYSFRIVTERDQDQSWDAAVAITTGGPFVSPEGAVKALIPSVEHLLRMLKITYPEGD